MRGGAWWAEEEEGRIRGCGGWALKVSSVGELGSLLLWLWLWLWLLLLLEECVVVEVYHSVWAWWGGGVSVVDWEGGGRLVGRWTYVAGDDDWKGGEHCWWVE